MAPVNNAQPQVLPNPLLKATPTRCGKKDAQC